VSIDPVSAALNVFHPVSEGHPFGSSPASSRPMTRS